MKCNNKKGAFSALLVFCALIFTLTACNSTAPSSSGEASGGDSSSSQPANRLEAIKARGYLEVATEPYFAPNEFIDSTKNGEVVGSDIELAKRIADRLGVELRVVPLEFTAVLSSVTEGKYDMAISSLAYMPSRAEAMELSKGYYVNPEQKGYGLLVRAEDADQYQSFDDFQGKTIACQSGSLQEMFVTDQMSGLKEVVRVSSSTDAYLMVSEGKADAAACSIASAELYTGANEGLATLDFKFYFDPQYDGTRVGIPKGETELLDAVNQVIDEVVESGEYEEWYAQYTEYAKTLGIE